jgi:hypothetical protein
MLEHNFWLAEFKPVFEFNCLYSFEKNLQSFLYLPKLWPDPAQLTPLPRPSSQLSTVA